MKYYIIVFKNTHTAMSGEKKLKEVGMNFRIMPTPTTITQSCGICIRLEDENSVNRVINDELIEFKAIYKRDGSVYELVK
ncbi:DUF3343 domain-containing protein [Clostridium saudiense]|nr:DUF3343 domain-containing protein [Clostridium saudiense]MBM6859406.1 DUF3343 domain-containing protein [Clostridium saudiense]